MQIAGFQRLTLIDYPGKIATTVFTIGCNFRCPFCHNPELVVCDSIPLGKSRTEEEFFRFLKTRKGKLEGVCITGGEPTIQPDLLEFMQKLKTMGFSVKLDSNGTRPDVLKKAIDMKVVDYIAMDIKNNIDSYEKTIGGKFDPERIKLSVELIRSSQIDHEFRTTVVPGIHTEKDFIAIGKWLRGADTYWLQRYREMRILDPNLSRKTKGKKLDLEKIKKKIDVYFKKVSIRG